MVSAMKRPLGILIAFFVFSAVAFAEDASMGWTPAKIGYVTFKLDVKSIPNRQAVYGLDFGFPATSSEKVGGLQIGLFMTESSGTLSGLQVAGFGNVANRMIGIQCGAFNLAEKAGGFQIGVGNTGKGMYGVQIGLGGNIAESLVGLQLSALTNNFDYDRLDRGVFHSGIVGFQIAPVTNITTTIKGGQVGAFNFSRDTSGFQIGITNRSSGTMKGVQIGLVNWCGNLKGLQVGLISHVKGRSFLKTLPLINLGF